MPEVVVVATMTAKPGREADLDAALRGLVEPTHEEDGCIRYALHRALDDPARMIIVERWRSREDLDEHFTRPHMQAVGEQASDLLAEPPQITFLEAVATGDGAKGTL